jgi:hypothetical protein
MQAAYCFIPGDTKFLKLFTVAKKLQKGRQEQIHALKISSDFLFRNYIYVTKPTLYGLLYNNLISFSNKTVHHCVMFPLGIKTFCMNHKRIPCVLKSKYYLKF